MTHAVTLAVSEAITNTGVHADRNDHVRSGRIDSKVRDAANEKMRFANIPTGLQMVSLTLLGWAAGRVPRLLIVRLQTVAQRANLRAWLPRCADG